MAVASTIALDVPHEVEIVGRINDSPTVFTLQLRLTDPVARANYRSSPGQFNALYLYGCGEVPISIVSDNPEQGILEHTIRSVGRVTKAMSALQPGDRIGLRGPFGRGWPLEQIKGHQVMVITGGLGCAPVVSAINHMLDHRSDYGHLFIIQGVKREDDLIWRERYELWDKQKDIQVLLAADVGSEQWPWHVGLVTELIQNADFISNDLRVLMCGPEVMMRAAVGELRKREVPEANIWLSLERNMQCGIRQCGHCQFGSKFICQDGPVFVYPEIRELFGIRGF